MKYCTNCLMPETRPRLTFNEEGVCGACQWTESKKTIINWDKRWEQLIELCQMNKNRNKGRFDCIVPVSGGKDSSYVAYKMKHELGMHPLTVTIAPPLPFKLGEENLKSFVNVGFDHIQITPNPEVGRKLARHFFEAQGQPLLAWIISVQTTIFRIATLFDIPFVMFGEEGEGEYGGSTTLRERAFYNVEESISLYLSGNNPLNLLNNFSEEQLYWWQFPTKEELEKLDIQVAHWSYFQEWDSYEHYLFAKEKCGLKERSSRNIGTYNNFAQNDTSVYDLHAYLMYLKFGFGRCTQDVGIDIRRGALARKQGLALVRQFDGEYPKEYIQGYLEYFQMSNEEFQLVLDKHTNNNLFKREGNELIPKFLLK